MMANYYVNDSRPELQRAVAFDWADSLGEFPWWAISEACQKWIRMERRRPTPADIRELCHRAVKADALAQKRLREIVRKQGRDQRPDNVMPLRRMPV